MITIVLFGVLNQCRSEAVLARYLLSSALCLAPGVVSVRNGFLLSKLQCIITMLSVINHFVTGLFHSPVIQSLQFVHPVSLLTL